MEVKRGCYYWERRKYDGELVVVFTWYYDIGRVSEMGVAINFTAVEYVEYEFIEEIMRPEVA